MEEIIKRALASGDKKQIAFAAGWVTHCCGDMGCHGLFVNPEAGVYLDKPEGRPLHMELEKNAEPVLWVDKGGYTKEDYKVTGIAGRFASSDKIPYQLLIDSANAVHGSAPSQNEVKGWIDLFHLALKTGVGYKYTAYDDAKAYLSNGGRYDRLMAGFDSATRRCLDLLTGAEKGDYSQFVDRWNLDVGRSDSPISNLKLAIKTASQSLFNFGTGTDDYVYFGIRFKDSTVKEYELDNGKYYGVTMNDFEAGNVDLFHLYIDKNSDRFSPENIDSIYLKKVGAPLSIGGDWEPEYIEVYLNGVRAVKETINYYITDESPVWEKKVSITGVEAIPDPADPVL